MEPPDPTHSQPTRTAVLRGLRSVSTDMLRKELLDAYNGMLDNRPTLAFHRNHKLATLTLNPFPSDVYMKLLVRALERRKK